MLSTVYSILLIDDDDDVLDAYQLLLEQAGYVVYTCNQPQHVLALIPDDWPGLIISDVCMPDISGLTLLEDIRAKDPFLPILLISGHGDVPMAVDAVKRGANDFLEKPINPEILLAKIAALLAERKRAVALKQSQQQYLDSHVIGESEWTKQFRQNLQRLAQIDAPVFLSGEVGSGRTFAAHYIHRLSPRGDQPFVTHILSASQPLSLTQCRQEVMKGSLCLTNIEQLPLEQQRQLAHHQSGLEKPFRLLVTSQFSAHELVLRQQLVPELYYYFSQNQLVCLPLKQRPDDILPLFRYYLAKCCFQLKREMPKIDAALEKHLLTHAWAGNLNELVNAAELFAVGIMPFGASLKAALFEQSDIPLDHRIEAYEKKIIEDVLIAFNGRVSDAADYLKIPRKKLYLRMKKYQLDKGDFK